MPAIEEASISELSYQAYQDRQYGELTLSALRDRATQLRPGGRARWDGERWSPLPYAGLAMQAMLHRSRGALDLADRLVSIQNEILGSLKEPGSLYPLPAASFHQTVANTFSAERLNQRLIQPKLYEAFPEMVRRATQDWIPARSEQGPAMRLVGIGLFRTALGALGVFEEPDDFARIIGFRDHFYGNAQLSEIGLRRTRPFIGHVTLAYVEAELSESQKESLVARICAVNERLRDESLVMEMPFAELHRYDNLSEFIYDPKFPSIPL